MRRLIFIIVVLLFFPLDVYAIENAFDSYGTISYKDPIVNDPILDIYSPSYVSGMMNINDSGYQEWRNKASDSNFSPVPEPATMILLGSGLIALGWIGRKKLFKGNRP